MSTSRQAKKAAYKNGRQPASVLSQNSNPGPSPSLSHHLAAFSTRSQGDSAVDATATEVYYATVTKAVDADTVRVYSVHSSQCLARWASTGINDRVAAIEWVNVRQSQQRQSNDNNSNSNSNPAPRGKKRRKSGSLPAAVAADASVTEEAGRSPTQDSAVGSPYLALGLVNGSILLLHPTRSVVTATLSHSSVASSVRALSFLPAPAAQGKTASPAPLLWASYAGGKYLVWNLDDVLDKPSSVPTSAFTLPTQECSSMAVRHELTGSAATPAFQLLVASHAISAFRVSFSRPAVIDEPTPATSVPLATFTGHTATVTSLQWTALSPAGLEGAQIAKADFISVASAERFVNLWALPTADVSESTPEGRLVATASMDHNIAHAGMDTAGRTLHALASDGTACIFDLGTIPTSGSSEKKKRRKSGLSSLSPMTVVNTSPKSALAACATILSADTLLLAFGGIQPGFERVILRDAQGQPLPIVQVTSAKSNSNLLAEGVSEKKTKRRDVYKEPTQSAVISAHAIPGQPAGGIARKGQNAGLEPTLAHRLKVLNMKGPSKVAKGEAQTIASVSSAPTKRIADATSLSQTLVQALHSSDTRLLESCLGQTNLTTIRATVKRLPSPLVVTLVDAIVQRLGKSKNSLGTGTGAVHAHRGVELMQWLRCVLMIHLSYLVTVPGLTQKFSSLYATLESRLLAHHQLLALDGRLDLVVSQIEALGDPAMPSKSQPALAPASTPAPTPAPLPLSAPAPAKKVQAQNKPKKLPKPKPISTVSRSTYREGQDDGLSSSSDDEVSSADEAIPPVKDTGVEAAEEDGEIEDLDLGSEAEQAFSEDDDSDSDAVLARKRKGGTRLAFPAKVNGFLDVEAEESEDEEDEDEEGHAPPNGSVNGIAKFPVGALLNGRKNGKPTADEEEEDDDDEEAEADLDKYESDFINDDSESEAEDESDDE